MYKSRKVFDTLVHKSFQRFPIYYISFAEAILIFSAWLTEKKSTVLTILFFISGCCLILEAGWGRVLVP